VVTRGWEKQSDIPAVELAERVAAMGVARIIYTDIARDGMLEGVNVEQTCAVARRSGLAVTASGGVSSLADIERLKVACDGEIDSVIVGKALYEKRFSLPEALQAATSRAL
jgi:phosphoribosylformimino-5-aminoimidazole carboxamide ribotide isomerase